MTTNGQRRITRVQFSKKRFACKTDCLGRTLRKWIERIVNGISHLQMVNEFVLPQLALHFNDQYWEGMFRCLWWVQDGVPPHRLVEVRERLNYAFGNNRVIGLGHNVEWEPHSANLTPSDFFFGDVPKAKYFLLYRAN